MKSHQKMCQPTKIEHTSSFAFPTMMFLFSSLWAAQMSFQMRVGVQLMVGIFGFSTFSLEAFGAILGTDIRGYK